ncbi:MAG TPA: hypothetical protein VIP79_04335, partial [Gemmatimonadaceae bacterium]
MVGYLGYDYGYSYHYGYEIPASAQPSAERRAGALGVARSGSAGAPCASGTCHVYAHDACRGPARRY